MDWLRAHNPFRHHEPAHEPAPMPEHAPPQTGPGGAGGPEAGPHQSLHDRYQSQAYARLGLSEQEFNSMDPVERNTRINASYAQMYLDNPDTMKWAGMASYASEAVGVGMMQARMLNMPGVGRLTGAPSGDRLREMFARGNGELYQDIMWQHLAMEHGGIDELRRAAKEDPSSVQPAQLVAWGEIDAAQKELAKARQSGDQAAMRAAQDRVWQGNGHLLQFEQQQFLQGRVYDRDRDAARFLDSGWNVLGVNSPIPGGESFGDFRGRTHAGGHEDVGDVNQRWDWISQSMLPSFRNLEESNNGQMQSDLRRMVANRNSSTPGNPVNMDHPLDSPGHAPAWMPRMNVPALPDARTGGGGRWGDLARSLAASPMGLF